MGLTRSTPSNNYRSSAPPTEREIRAAIDNLFQTGRANNISDYSQASINFNAPTEEAPAPKIGGYGRPAKYEKYYIDFDRVIQNGGVVSEGEDSEDYEKISEFSEFERIKQHLLKTMGKGQSGGDMIGEDDDLTRLFDQAVSETTEPGAAKLKNLRNFLYVLTGGNDEVEDEDDDDEDEEEKEDMEPLEAEDVDEKEKDDDDDDDDGDDDDDDEVPEEEGMNKFSETSYNGSPDLNILPFYSTSSSSDYSFKHPYIKNRFE